MRRSKRKALLAILRNVPYCIDFESASWKHTDISEDLLKQWAEQLADMRRFDLGFAGLGLGDLQIKKGDLTRIGIIDKSVAAMARHLYIPTDIHFGAHFDFRPVCPEDALTVIFHVGDDAHVQKLRREWLEEHMPPAEDLSLVFTGTDIDQRIRDAAKLCLEKRSPDALLKEFPRHD